MKKFLVFLFAVFFIFVSASAWATQVSVTSDAFTDTRYLNQTSPQNYPDGMFLWSGQQVSKDIHAYTFLQFNLSGDMLSPSSELYMYCNYVYGDYDTTTKVWYLDDDSWSDDTITYNNMPDFWTSPNLLDQLYIDSIGWYSWDVGAVSDSDGIISFVIGSLLPSEAVDGDYWRDFENLEYTGVNHAYLTGVAPIPEPATMLLLGSGLIGLAGFSKKKLKK